MRAWVGDDEAPAMPSLKAAAAQYASFPAYARQFEQVGLGREAVAAAAAREAGRIDDVPEELVRAVCAVGGSAASKIQEFRDAGADLPVVYPVAFGAAPTCRLRVYKVRTVEKG